MDLKQLEYFVNVAETGSFTKAAQLLKIAQPALSRQVRLLEVELRQTLLNRNGRGAIPTESGKLLLQHAKGILRQLDHAVDELAKARGALTGRVAIGIPPSLARMMTVPFIHLFRKILPDASLSISEGLSISLQESLALGKLDIALLYNAHSAVGIEVHAVHQEELYLVRPGLGSEQKSVEHVSVDCLAELPLVIPSRPNAIRMQVENEMAKVGLKLNVALEIDGVPAILDLVADGAGVAVLSGNAMAYALRSNNLTTSPFDPPLKKTLYIATSSHRPTTLAQKATIPLIEKVVLGQ